MEIYSLRMLIIHLSSDGLNFTELREAVLQECPQIDHNQFNAVLYDLQIEGILVGHEGAGESLLAAVDNGKQPEWPEYSQEFANRILAIEKEEFVEIDVDDLIAQLDIMIQKARARKSRRKRASRVVKDSGRLDQS